MSNFMDEYNFNLIHSGDIVKGKIIKLLDDGVIADIGYKSDAYISKDQLSLDPNINIYNSFKEGDEIDLYIIKREDENGNVVASKVKADIEMANEKLDAAYKNGYIINGKVIEVVKGGVIADVLGVKAFIPASLLDVQYIKDLNDYVGKDVRVKIIEHIPHKKLVASQKAVLEEENMRKKEDLFSQIKEGQIIEGTVKNITKFGAFIDVGGVDGLIPISEISWGRIKDISEVLKVGDMVNVYVVNVDKDKDRITLSLRNLIPEPWSIISGKYKIGDIIKGKIVSITTFGVFVEIEPGIEGLLHKSNLIRKIKEYSEGTEIIVEILDVDYDNKKISLKEVDKNNEVYELKSEELNVSIKDRIE
ncbi:S1 RNA-binding domain-containing protein [Thermoanaerobacterium sp. RBIITD]|uniref:30S ribosomal protein S1 n=1 Tax=Thermoanaerobacterium sp. RBIITD TaxID=1550240 RepID=UPI000BB8BD02|nr:S1 RNA-binding domain-containing protein [Thermoanaerobacterium sp. RBIITD]SNX55425.1 small subunit ribosomal protein S1 [Thermoanaerobacterium sp. RBIITD]